MSHHTLDYKTIMREKGYRVTPQRQLILDAICEGNGHTTPEEIYQRLQQKASAINLATVYRTLDFLCELGLIVSADVGLGQKVYEIAKETPHHHLVCQKCEQVQELPHALVAPFFTTLETKTAFKINTDHLVLFGVCENCQ